MSTISTPRRRAVLTLAAGGLFAARGPAAFAQEFPTKPIKVLCGFAPGGPTDVIARIVAADITQTLGQSVIVENRAGANSLIATQELMRAAPDGYTLIAATLAHNINPILMPDKAKYNPIRDVTAVSLAATVPMIAVTGFDSPINSIADVVSQARAKPGAVTYGSAGHGGSAHLAAAALGNLSKTDMTHVPFKGNAPALTEVMGGRVSFMFYPMVGIADQVAARRLKALAVTTAKRHPDFPNVPTMAELGYPGFEDYSPGIPFLAPAGTPAPIVEKLSAAIRASVARPETREKLRQLGAVAVGSTPAELVTWLQMDYDRWDRLIKAAGVKAE
ncbi:MAG: tripartite tricarboxylate transporter substrate binding protein [Burkholderiales bacterium]|jgi:tripartite-type tricarboxylate transporter receptor subunit TctC